MKSEISIPTIESKEQTYNRGEVKITKTGETAVLCDGEHNSEYFSGVTIWAKEGSGNKVGEIYHKWVKNLFEDAPKGTCVTIEV